MKIMKRLLCVSIAILLVFASLTACAPRPQEELTDLDLIKAEWQRYVVDRTEEVNSVGVGRWSLSDAIMPMDEQSVINEVLNICQTLDPAKLAEAEDPSGTWDRYDLSVILLVKESPEPRYISVFIYKSGEAYMSLVQAEEDREETKYWAHISNWPVYEQLKPYIDYWKNKGG